MLMILNMLHFAKGVDFDNKKISMMRDFDSMKIMFIEELWEILGFVMGWIQNLRSIKIKMFSFQGRNDPDTYFEWKKKLELIFDYHNYSKDKKVELVVI